MIFFKLTFKSLCNRKATAFLTLFSIAMSAFLLLSLDKIKSAAEAGFTQTISQTDLVVGARTGPINLMLYTVFNLGSASNNISYESYEEFKKNPAVAWTIPFSLGDGHRGFRVVGTDESFYKHYRYRTNQSVHMEMGSIAQGLWDVVLGAEVAKALDYKIGQKIVIAHGVTRSEGILLHEDKPFTVVGILKPTGTVLDKSLYITLEGLEAMHIDWKDGAAPQLKDRIAAEKIQKENIKVREITAFFLRTKNRIETLRLQREINTYTQEPLLAVIPGVVLSEIWRSIGYLEVTLRMISLFVLVVAIISMVSTLLSSLNERRREMSILRSLGCSPFMILKLLVFESFCLTGMGLILGYLLEIILFSLLESWLASEFGLFIQKEIMSQASFINISIILVSGCLAGFIPAYRSMRLALKDGLTIKI